MSPMNNAVGSFQKFQPLIVNISRAHGKPKASGVNLPDFGSLVSPLGFYPELLITQVATSEYLQIQGNFSVGLGPHKTYRQHQQTIALLTRAITQVAPEPANHRRQRWPLSMTLRVAETRELVGWILHFGSGVRVLQPESLREKVQEEARKIFQEM